jgi:hypothetical protein
LLIPHDWVESGEGDDYLYHRPNADSGLFRISLITVPVDGGTPAERLAHFFDGRANVFTEPLTGNVVYAYEKDSEEDGVPIHLFYWMVANVVSRNLIREAIFSYTVRSDCVDDEETKQEVVLVGQLVSQANLAQSDSLRP